MQLKHSRIILTGATGGLGQALASQLAAGGARLLLVGRNAEKLAALSAMLGAGHSTLVADLAQPAGIAATVGAAREFAANVLINNAGVGHFGMFDQHDWATQQHVLLSDLLMPMQLTHALLPWFKQRDAAAIVNIGSTFGSLPFPGFVAYSAAKAGLRGFSQALRRELADSRIAVTHFSPRAIDTPLNSPAVNALNRELGNRADSADSVARQIVIALCKDSDERHFGFPERLFAWLNGIAPCLIDRALAGKLPTIRHHATPGN